MTPKNPSRWFSFQKLSATYAHSLAIQEFGASLLSILVDSVTGIDSAVLFIAHALRCVMSYLIIFIFLSATLALFNLYVSLSNFMYCPSSTTIDAIVETQRQITSPYQRPIQEHTVYGAGCKCNDLSLRFRYPRSLRPHVAADCIRHLSTSVTNPQINHQTTPLSYTSQFDHPNRVANSPATSCHNQIPRIKRSRAPV